MSGTVKNFDRMVVLTTDVNLGTAYVPPTIAQIVAAVTDPNHAAMISTGLYNQTQVNALRADAFAYFNNTFGIDFSVGFVLANGTIVLPNFIMIPYSNLHTSAVHVSFDSAHMDRGSDASWYGYQFGELVVALTAGLITGGTHIGDNYGAGDIMTLFDYNLMKTDGNPPSPDVQREILRARTPWIGKNISPNSQGYSDSPSKLEVVDEDGNVGFYAENIMFIKYVDTGLIYDRTRSVLTWNK